MLQENIFEKNNEMESQVEKVLITLLSFSKDQNKILRIDDLKEATLAEKNIFNLKDVVAVGSVISNLEDKNVFILNDSENLDLSEIYKSLNNLIPKYGKRNSLKNSVSILNNVYLNGEEDYMNNLKIKNDISLFRNLQDINIFIPADSNEAEYLLKVNEKGFFKGSEPNRFSYFRFVAANSFKIFKEDYFIKEGNLKEYTGLPEIIHLSKNQDSPFEVAIISCGPIIHNALYAAKELEDRNYKVSVLNFSLISSNNNLINEKIKNFIVNFSKNHKNILVVEEHSKIGGLGSLISEIVSETKGEHNVRVERLGLEDDLSPRNIISKAEEIAGL